MEPTQLMDFGLTKNEAIVYLSLSRLREAKVSTILRESGFRSGKIYQVLDSLMAKGLVSYVTKNNVKNYSALTPRKIIDLMEAKKARIALLETDFLRLLPALESSFGTKEQLSVNVY
jgi:sugar-specific transcriptional regulator TrmB